MSPANLCEPFYSPGEAVTGQASSAVTGKRFVKISGNRVSGPALGTTTDGGNYQVAPATTGDVAFGVAGYDAASGKKVKVHTSPGVIVPVTASGAINAGQEVVVGTAGKAVAYDSTIALTGNAQNINPVTPRGLCLTGATDGNDAEIKLY